VAPRAEKRNSFRLSVEKPERKRLLRRPRRRWEYLNLRQGGCVGVEYMHPGRIREKW
jgi:hypothetical protein